MEKVYANLIVKGKKQFSNIPDELKDEVKKILTEWGYEQLIIE